MESSVLLDHVKRFARIKSTKNPIRVCTNGNKSSASLDIVYLGARIIAMALPNYTPERRREIATELEIDEQYLYQVTRGLKTASPALAMGLHKIDPLATLQDLRPNDYAAIWPDLQAKKVKCK